MLRRLLVGEGRQKRLKGEVDIEVNWTPSTTTTTEGTKGEAIGVVAEAEAALYLGHRISKYLM